MRLVLTLALALVVFGLASEAEAKKKVKPIPTVMTVFLGFSEDTARGDGGQLPLHRICAAEFEAARMCTSQEILTSPTMPDDLGGAAAWVHPVLVPDASTSGVDVSGAAPNNPRALSCEGYSDDGTGLTVSSMLAYTPAPCAVERPVACCGPRVINVMPEEQR